MWHSLNETLSDLCSSAFWRHDVTWNSPDPKFTSCFEKTILIWFPCLYLWIFTPLEIFYLRRTVASEICFNFYNISKLVLISLLGVTSLVDIAYYVFFDSVRYSVDIHTPVIKWLTFCLFFALTYANIKCGVRSSGVLFIFSFLLAFCGAPQFRSVLKANFYGSTVNDVNLEMVNSVVSYLMYYPLVVIVFLLNCFADACPTGLNQSIGKNPCPENASSFLSKILFSWFDKFAWRGYKNPLKDEDIWDLDYEMQTTRIVQSFESKWHRTLHRLQKSGGIRMRYENEKLLENGAADRSNMGVEYINSCSKKASILYPMFEVFGASFMFGVILKLFHSGLNFASPQILNLILAFVDSKNKEFVWRGFFYVFLLLVVAILQMLLLNYHFHIMFRIGLRIRTALVSAIYKKALKISNGARRDFAFGEIVNLMSVDAQRFVQMLIFIPLLWVSPAEVCLSFYCLWNILGPSILVGLAILILLMVVAGWIISKIQKLQVKQMKYKDKRVKLTNEILSGIKVLKLYACEPSFERYVNEIRSEEIKILKNTGYLHAGSSFAWICTPFLVSFVTFGVYVLSDEKNVLDAQIAFVSLSLFNVMKFSMELLPIVVKEMVQTSVAVKRINKFLNSEELDPNAVSHEQRYEPIVIEDGNFSWEDYKSQPILSNINVTVNSGDLVAIVGAVGSGKSSLLSAILGEMYKQSGYVNTAGTLAYVPQQAWIQNATLRNNITFGDKVKSSFYDSVIEACALIPDLEILPGGDQTEIGEKGINVSGGQKQRISLARAVYSGADVYLLDDPLSAVDAHVGKHIFEKVIGPNGLLKKKTRVFVTHNVSYLPQVDHIIVLQNGIISETGTYAELLKKGGDFATFLLAYTKENEADELTQSAHATHAHKDVTELKLEIRRENDNDEKVPKRHKKVSESEQRQETVKAVPDNLTAEEGIQTGNVKWKVYTYYLRAVGSFMVCVTILTNLLYQVFAASSDYWLSAWSSDAKTLSTMTDDRMAQQYKYLVVYALLGLGQAVSVMTQTVALYVGMLRAAKYIHNCLLISVLHWPVVTFDKIPYGRIINRFGFDVDVLDNTLPANMLELLLYTAIVMSNLFVISCNTPLIITVFLPVAALYYFLQRVYVATSKQLKRLESASKSPIYSHFGDSITGAQSIRAYGLQTKFIKTSEIKVDFNLKSSYAGMLVQRWLQVRLDLLGAVIVFSAALFAVLGRNIIGPALVGLSVTYALQVTGNLHWWIRMISEVETNVVAVERIKEYSEMAEEAAWILPNDESVPENWPCKGQITFTNFQVRYHETLEPVLKGINFSVNGGQKVGIVGRTGAGKSSLTLSLFRIIESSGGRILIDDVDISKIGLHTLRGRLTIIPQDPVLFSGTVRMNLDPAAAYSDDSVWRTLELTNLKTYVSSLSGGLQYLVEEGGSNFSIGQRQLICLARALLRKTKVLILDEATAAVDFETDDLIQATIRKEFRDCTVLTIAHRLNTILDYDRIMVLDKGHVAEFDSPSVLLQSKQSIFYSMAKDAKLV